MKKLCYTFFLLFFGLLAQAQNISVADFYYAENDLTARTHGTSMEDQNGNICALIKVKTTERGSWAFDVGMLGVWDTQMQNAAHPAEIWVYVPFGVTWISIQHDKLGELDHYRFPCSIDKGCTYVMKLTTGKVNIYIEEEVTEQWLVFEITPHDAILEVDDKMWPVSEEGTAKSMMPFGSYTYRVQAQNYHPAVGKVEVNDSENSHVVPVTLKPNFGWIEVSGDNGLSGASVYIDNALIGKAPCKSEALKSGQHNVRILKEMFEPYTESVTVNDNETTSFAPILTSDFAHITLEVDADAEIWVNDELKGTRTWTGDLRTGTYRIECKQQGHEPTMTKKTVTNSMNGEVVTLQAPIPIYGSLNVECTPDLATLYIDGKEVGKAPKLVGKILVGEHEIRLTKDGYAEHKETVTIAKGERKQVNATLSNGKEIQFTCNASNARLTIDGTPMSDANGTYKLTFGSHRIEAKADGYEDFAQTLSVSESTNRFSVEMKVKVVENSVSMPAGVKSDVNLIKQGNDFYDAKKYETALWCYLEAAKLPSNKNNNALFTRIGYMYDEGLGVTEDDAEAVKWYRKAADQGHASAQYNLGLMYQYGKGVPENKSEALKWYRKAAAQGHEKAQNKLKELE